MTISYAGKVTQLTLENTRKRCKISSKSTVKTPCLFIVNFATPFSKVPVVDFE